MRARASRGDGLGGEAHDHRGLGEAPPVGGRAGDAGLLAHGAEREGHGAGPVATGGLDLLVGPPVEAGQQEPPVTATSGGGDDGEGLGGTVGGVGIHRLKLLCA